MDFWKADSGDAFGPKTGSARVSLFFLSFLDHLSFVVFKAQIDSGYKISKAVDFYPLLTRLLRYLV